MQSGVRFNPIIQVGAGCFGRNCWKILLRKLPKTVGTDGERLFHVIEKEKEGLPKSRAPKKFYLEMEVLLALLVGVATIALLDGILLLSFSASAAMSSPTFWSTTLA